jgi:crossover junction endodeoxyribonuclease RusA
MIFKLPFPPSVNNYYAVVRGRNILSRKGRAYKALAADLVALARLRLGKSQPLAGPVKVEIEVYPPNNRVRDLDNLLKATLDAVCTGGAFQDDSQIVDLRIRKLENTKDGKVVVHVSEKV